MQATSGSIAFVLVLLLAAAPARPQDPDPTSEGLSALSDGRLFDAREALGTAALDGEDPIAQYVLGVLCAEGLGGGQDGEKARLFMEAAASKGMRRAVKELGIFYEMGVGGEPDSAKAADQYERAAALGDIDAINRLGVLIATGRGRPQDPIEAFAWFLTTAKSGDKRGAGLLGRVILDFGLTDEQKKEGEKRQAEIANRIRASMKAAEDAGTIQLALDFDDAIQAAFLRGEEAYSAEEYDGALRILGDLADAAPPKPDAQFYLGRMYEMGRGVEADPARAADLYRAAARSGMPVAFFNLAWMYDEGRGVEKNPARANELLDAAAYRGWWNAMTEAARRRLAGEGYARYDPVEVFALLSIAADDGSREDAIKFRKLMQENGDISSEQVEAARKRAEEIRAAVERREFPPVPEFLRGASKSAAVDQSTPTATVESWIAAVKAGDKAAALSLGTEAWRAKETTWDRSFTTAIFDKGFELLECEVREPEIEGESARVSCRAVFLVEGERDNEGLRFRLVLVDGKWLIAELG